MDANGHLGTRERCVRLDRLLEAVLAGHQDDYELTLALRPLSGLIDVVGATALMTALVQSRIRSGADELVLGVRSNGGAVEFALWDDGRPIPFTSEVSFLARLIGARAFGRAADGGVGITVTLGTPATARAA